MPTPVDRQLARLIRQSPALDPALKRHWLDILPHLKPSDRIRLQSILAGTRTDELAAPEATRREPEAVSHIVDG